VALGSLVLARVVYTWHRPDRATIAPFILVGMLGYALISPWLPTELPPNHITHYMDSQRWQIKGIVTQKLQAQHGRSRYLLQVNQLSDLQQAIAVTGYIRLTIAGELPIIEPGTPLTFTGRIRSFHNFNNPGGFDYRRHMLFQHVYGSAFVASDHLCINDSNEKPEPSAMMRYRAQARQLIEQVNDPTAQSVLKTILLGDRQAISQDVRHLFNRCGIGHLLAISGLHIGIVGGLAFAFGLWGLNWWPAVLERGWGRRGAALLAIGTMVFYASLAGLAPATQRALIMILAFMITYFVYHEGDTLNFLALAAVLMLLWNPPVLFSISFQMSFAAVFWIVVGLSTVKREEKYHSIGVRRWFKRIYAFLLMTFWATIGTLPLVMSYFQEISLIGLATNCIMVPLIGFLVLPCGLLGLMIFPLNGVFAGWCLQAAGWGLAQALDGLQVLNTVDGIALSTFVPTVFEITCYYAVLGLILMRRRIKRACWLFLLAAVVITADGGYWLHERFWHDDLRVTVLDVGQGSAALVEFPGGKTMLIDGGGFTDNRIFDVGQRIVAPFLRYRKILRIDTIVLSHPSSDHMNGLVYVLSHFHPQKLLWTGERASTASFANFQQALAESGTQAPDFTRLNRRMTIGGADVMILHPEISRMQGLHRFSGGDCNNHSLVVKVAMGNCGILFPGDIEIPAEKRLIDCCRHNVASQVLVAPHHGSRTSSSKSFLDAVRPEKVVISAGWRNRFGFPHKTVLKRYQALGSEVFRTDNQGAVLLRTDGHRWQTKTQLK
jgi:competence protein ComEC